MKQHLVGLPSAEAELFMQQIRLPKGFWGKDFRWATCWREEDGTWVVHVNERPGGYYVGEWRLPPGGHWQDVEDDYDHEAENERIAATPPERAPHQEFLRGQAVHCMSWHGDDCEIWEATVVRYCGGDEASQSYNVTHPKWGQVGVTRWRGGDFPTNVFGSQQEAKDLRRVVLERRDRH